MTYTEQDIVSKLNELCHIYHTMGALYRLNAGIKLVECLAERAEDCKKDAKSMAESFCMAQQKSKAPIKRMFKDDSGRVAIKVDLVSDVDEARLFKTLIDNHRDEFLARAPQICKFIMKGIHENPIEGVNLEDYKLPGYFRSSEMSTPKMYKTIDKSIQWALDGAEISDMMPKTDELDERMSLLDSIKRACRDLIYLKEVKPQ